MDSVTPDVTPEPDRSADDEATVWSIAPVRGALENNALADILSLLEAAGAADGTRALSDQSLVLLRSGEERRVETFLAYAHAPARISARPGTHAPGSLESLADEARLAGLAVVTDADGATLELVVHPHYRQQGLGRALVDAAVSTLGHDGLVDASSLGAWAHGNTAAAVQLAASAGFVPVRRLVKMIRPSSTPLPARRELPTGMKIRAFDPARDVDAWVRLNARVFADHPEQGSITADDVRARMREPWFDAEDFLLVVDDAEAILAYNWLKRTQDEAEIYALGVASEARGLGLGAVLTSAGIERLQSEGPRDVALYTEGDNIPALALYADYGFEQVMVDVMYAPADAGDGQPVT
ncbi:mycothiol synthase [Falsarthrobacter nasiphocae]|uniref:Mycothiol acetyltransferase n=1 Tax=Falsarthrobacter nasiphocae TaxID=189863 RepID=A0AAE4C5N0_9MICC|nr:mycothiol synthase [Falsarthrobacter nasiphocae]MDR6892491.1 mycothiol synthase [Falsarthrobacter nasiphocae]